MMWKEKNRVRLWQKTGVTKYDKKKAASWPPEDSFHGILKRLVAFPVRWVSEKGGA